MHIENLRTYCLSKKAVTEEFPFDEVTLVFKVLGKIFLITGLDAENFSINIKCEPEKAEELRAAYPTVVPGYHMNKKHWNTVYIDGSVNDAQLKAWIDDSYWLVVKGLPKKLQAQLQEM